MAEWGLPQTISPVPDPSLTFRFPGCRAPLPCALTHSSNGRFPNPALIPVSMGAEVFRPPPPLSRIWLARPIFQPCDATRDATPLLRRNPMVTPQLYDATRKSRGGFRGPSSGPRIATSEVRLRPFPFLGSPLPRSVFLRPTPRAPSLQPNNRRAASLKPHGAQCSRARGSSPGHIPSAIVFPSFHLFIPPRALHTLRPKYHGPVFQNLRDVRVSWAQKCSLVRPPPPRTLLAFNFFKTAPRCPKLHSRTTAQFPETFMMPGNLRRRWPPPSAFPFPDTSFTSRFFLPPRLTPHTLQPIAHGASYFSI